MTTTETPTHSSLAYIEDPLVAAFADIPAANVGDAQDRFGIAVGLHPVWLMFALLAFGSLFGFLGLLLAVPVAASIGVVVRYALGRYLQSQLYHADEPVLLPRREP